MQELWKSILGLLEKVIIPDWGDLIALIPLALLGLVLLFLALTVRAYAGAGPTRRAPARRTPVTPASLHMPGPSAAPILGAVGSGMLLWGLVVGGNALTIGLVVFIAGLLYWGREAIRDYDHATNAQTLPAVVHAGPPPGVHMPGPSYRPLTGAFGTAALLFGLVYGGWLLGAGLIIFVATLVGWLVDARAEYVKTVEADRTGHMENIPAPRSPRRLLTISAVLIVLAVLADAGIFPPRADETAGGPGGTPAPSEPAAEPATAFEVSAKDITFSTKSLTVVADAQFTITFANADANGIPHDIDIRAADKQTVLQDQAIANGGTTVNYVYAPLGAGSYIFICSIHPIEKMTGTVTVR